MEPERCPENILPPVDAQEADEESALTQDMRALYREEWRAIRTYQHRNNPVQDVLNLRLPELNLESLLPQLWDLFRNQTTAFKINLSFGFILRNIENGELRYFHSSHNNARMLPQPMWIHHLQDFENFLQFITQQDLLEWVKQQRPNSKWMVMSVTNVTFYINKLPQHPIGGLQQQQQKKKKMVTKDETTIIEYLKRNKGLVFLSNNHHGKPYEDNLCFFRVVAIHQSADWKKQDPLEVATQEWFTKLMGGEEDIKSFEGVYL